MIYFLKGKDEEINLSFNDLRKATAHCVSSEIISMDDVRNNIVDSYVVAEMSNVLECCQHGLNPNKIIGIGYSESSYYNHKTPRNLYRHYSAIEYICSGVDFMPFGQPPDIRPIRNFCKPQRIGVVCDFVAPRIDDLTYIYNPRDTDEIDALVYASYDDRRQRILRRCVSTGIPIIGYARVPLLKHLIADGLAFELKETDDFKNCVYNTLMYIGSNVPWQLKNSLGLFNYTKNNLNWKRWEHAFSTI